MDFHLKQWRNQQYESEHHQQQHSAKIPKLVSETHHKKPDPSSSGFEPLPLFVPEPNTKMITSSGTLSAFPADSTTPTASTTRIIPRMGSYFSLAQWQELELQALIFRYMLAGAAVPPELLQPIKKSISLQTPYFLHQSLQPYPHYQPSPAALFQSGYWGRAAMDPEPGRCRRTDGKKWRCSRDVVVGQKYCERHMHRGRSRSRKPVESPTPAGGRLAGSCAGGGGGALASNTTHPIATAPPPLSTSSAGTHFSLSGPSSSSIDLLHLNQSSSDVKSENKDLFETHNGVSGDGKSDGHILRHFFDDWPRSLEEPDNGGGSNNNNNRSPLNSATSLSISIPGNSSSDVSLKLSTGDGKEPGQRPEAHSDRGQPQLGWAAGWASNPMASMGGPLAEALRSSNSNSSPTSVLHQLPRGSAADPCIVSS
ncbi:Growth-regulating factor [Parasponia andersonii]|uniref:Growth-regulating factor n=1 Tax=Parasponia andersonii TaxID=3476 RepID=A0A2P5B227_PARAD|nr:Growth-regulating factor [Parasponia andersonii]